MTYSRYFSNFLQPCLFSTKDINTRKAYNRDTYIKDILAYASNTYIGSTCGKDICIKNAYIKIFCIDNICINSPNTIKCLKINL